MEIMCQTNRISELLLPMIIIPRVGRDMRNTSSSVNIGGS